MIPADKVTKKTIANFLVFTLLLLCAGCSNQSDKEQLSSNTTSGNNSSGLSKSSSISGDNVPSSEKGMADAFSSTKSSAALSVNPSEEPPLWRYYPEDITPPDFLNDEQKDIYCRAMRLSEALMVNTSAIDHFPLLPDQESKDQNEVFTVEGTHYIFRYSYDRYRNADDFFAMINSIFTEECFEKINDVDGNKRFDQKDGRLFYIDLTRGGDITRTQEPDQYRLVSSSETKIDFMVVGFYSDNGSHTEKEFPIQMVLTDAGWRISEFNITS